MRSVDHEDMVEALPPDRADQTFDERILPGRARRYENLLESHTANAIPEAGAIDPVAVPEQVPGHRVPRKALYDLLGCPAAPQA